MTDAPILHYRSVGSTMDEMARLLAAGPVEPWTAVVADFQSAGRGRGNRTWQAPPGSALLTTIYAPIAIESARSGLLTIAAGLAVADALTHLNVPVQLKWPNDVLATDRKLAGILITSRIDSSIHASVGVGLNVADSPRDAVSLAQLMPSPPEPLELLSAIRVGMRRRWSELESGRFASLRDEWNVLAAWRGQDVGVPDDVSIGGRLIGIDEWGRLRIDTGQGELTLTQSEIVRGPLPGGQASYTS